MGLMACMGSKSCCDTCGVDATWVGLSELADLGMGTSSVAFSLYQILSTKFGNKRIYLESLYICCDFKVQI